jgi:hypothetical protein
MYFSWKVQNPSAALYDVESSVDSSMSGGVWVSIPWSDDASNTQSRRKRDIYDMTTAQPNTTQVQ